MDIGNQVRVITVEPASLAPEPAKPPAEAPPTAIPVAAGTETAVQQPLARSVG